MTAVRGPERASPILWISIIVMVAGMILLAVVSRDQPNLGGPGDPDGVGSEGLLGMRLFIEEAGGDTQRNVGLPSDDVDVAMMFLESPFPPFGAEDGENAIRTWGPLLEWVEQGGTLLTTLDVEDGPEGGLSFVEEDGADQLRIQRGECDIDDLAGVDEIRPIAHIPVVIEDGDLSCFGDDDEAVVVVRNRGEGRIVRLASFGMFTNRALDDVDNAALLARLIRIDDEPVVAFLPSEPIWFQIDEEGIAVNDDGSPIEFGVPGGPFGGGPVDSDGNPIGAGEDGLLDLLPRSVLAMILGLILSAFIYVLAIGKRLGSPIVEPVPIQLPSSSYVDAVGRLYRKADGATARSSMILRRDLRTELARRVGMAADSSADEIAGALVATEQRQAVVDLLDGPIPTSDDEFVALATRLIETRSRVERGGASLLGQNEDISIVTERTSR